MVLCVNKHINVLSQWGVVGKVNRSTDRQVTNIWHISLAISSFCLKTVVTLFVHKNITLWSSLENNSKVKMLHLTNLLLQQESHCFLIRRTTVFFIDVRWTLYVVNNIHSVTIYEPTLFCCDRSQIPPFLVGVFVGLISVWFILRYIFTQTVLAAGSQ